MKRRSTTISMKNLIAITNQVRFFIPCPFYVTSMESTAPNWDSKIHRSHWDHQTDVPLRSKWSKWSKCPAPMEWQRANTSHDDTGYNKNMPQVLEMIWWQNMTTYILLNQNDTVFHSFSLQHVDVHTQKVWLKPWFLYTPTTHHHDFAHNFTFFVCY